MAASHDPEPDREARVAAVDERAQSAGPNGRQPMTAPLPPRLSDHAPQPPVALTCTNARFQPLNPNGDQQ